MTWTQKVQESNAKEVKTVRYKRGPPKTKM
jgi:hypothetical protein